MPNSSRKMIKTWAPMCRCRSFARNAFISETRCRLDNDPTTIHTILPHGVSESPQRRNAKIALPSPTRQIPPTTPAWIVYNET